MSSNENLSSNGDGTEARDINVRRCMEEFLLEMKRCNEYGSTDIERVAIANKHLSSLDQLQNGPLLSKVKELIVNFIDGKCRSLDTYIIEQAGESRELGAEWICNVCGKRNREIKKKYSECEICHRPKDCLLSKKLKRLNECRIDPTPHLTDATKEELEIIKTFGHHRDRWVGDEGKRLMFISKQGDYEALERTSIKCEIDNVLSSIRRSLDDSNK